MSIGVGGLPAKVIHITLLLVFLYPAAIDGVGSPPCSAGSPAGPALPAETREHHRKSGVTKPCGGHHYLLEPSCQWSAYLAQYHPPSDSISLWCPLLGLGHRTQVLLVSIAKLKSEWPYLFGGGGELALYVFSMHGSCDNSMILL